MQGSQTQGTHLLLGHTNVKFVPDRHNFCFSLADSTGLEGRSWVHPKENGPAELNPEPARRNQSSSFGETSDLRETKASGS